MDVHVIESGCACERECGCACARVVYLLVVIGATPSSHLVFHRMRTALEQLLRDAVGRAEVCAEGGAKLFGRACHPAPPLEHALDELRPSRRAEATLPRAGHREEVRIVTRELELDACLVRLDPRLDGGREGRYLRAIAAPRAGEKGSHVRAYVLERMWVLSHLHSQARRLML